MSSKQCSNCNPASIHSRAKGLFWVFLLPAEGDVTLVFPVWPCSESGLLECKNISVSSLKLLLFFNQEFLLFWQHPLIKTDLNQNNFFPNFLCYSEDTIVGEVHQWLLNIFCCCWMSKVWVLVLWYLLLSAEPQCERQWEEAPGFSQPEEKSQWSRQPAGET